MKDILPTCRWPDLPEPYLTALRQAVAYALDRYDVSAILASGTVLRGTPDRHSDLDIYVLHRAVTRQRVQKFFNGVPAEMFVNPPRRIPRYFEDENPSGRPQAAHMFATGFAVLDQDGELDRLVASARDWLAKAPAYPPQKPLFERYFSATMLEDALDVFKRDPAGSLMILGQAVPRMLAYYFIRRGENQPRHKDLLATVRKIDPDLAELTDRFYSAGPPAARLEAAVQLADRIIGTHSFFEWETDPEMAVHGG